MAGNHHKFIPIDGIIEKIYRDTQMSTTVDPSDVAEWVGEAIQLIGVPAHLRNRVAKMTIKDGKGELPCDLYNIIQVREYDSKTPMRSSTNTFHRHFKRNDTPDNDPTIDKGLYSDRAYDDVEGIYDNSGLRVESGSNTNSGDLTYEVNDNWIFPNFESGTIEMAYKAFPVSDSTGFPLIPDEISIKKAVEYYVRCHINHIEWRKGVLNDKVYQKEEQERHWYMAKAQTRIPTYDEMETLKNNHIRLIPKINHWEDFFENLGTQEMRYTHNSVKSDHDTRN